VTSSVAQHQRDGTVVRDIQDVSAQLHIVNYTKQPQHNVVCANIMTATNELRVTKLRGKCALKAE